MMLKKGDVWVSAVLYIALGMVLITLILSAGLPLIEKMRDKNTIIQTKNLLFNLNSNIESVANEGVGSKRYISPVVISSGALSIDSTNYLIRWKMTTKNLMMQPNTADLTGSCISPSHSGCETFKEGAITMWTIETAVEGEYDTYLELNYEGYIDIEAINAPATLTGKYSFSIEHKGFSVDRPKISITVT